MSQSIKSYKIVSAINPEHLCQRVEILLKKGYEFQGNIVMSVDAQANRHYAQAMILIPKHSDSPDEAVSPDETA